jgi:hypothetical protein
MINEEMIYYRLTAIDNKLLSIEHELKLLTSGNRRKWWETIAGSMGDIPEDEWKKFQNFCLYFRKTGKHAPDDWDGSDPIPFPPDDEEE